MGRYEEFKQAKNTLRNISKKPTEYMLIHYSCSDIFSEEHAKISSICLMNFSNRERHQFSISNYDKDTIFEEAEKELLKDFFEFIKPISSLFTFIHWNMNSTRYGFEEIQIRFRELFNETETSLSSVNKIDLDDLLGNLYSEKYVKQPKMKTLYDLNKLDIHDFILGDEASKLFGEEKWYKLSEVTRAKVDFLYEVLKKVSDGNLKVEEKFLNQKGIWLDKLQYLFFENRYGRFIFWIGSIILGGLITKVLGL